MTTTPSLTGYAWLSILAAILTMALKGAAYWITGSVGLLSDAAESSVNLVAAIFSLAMLSLAAKPADEGHPFGHGKAEYFASGFEGAMILVAAVGICWAAWDRLLHPQALVELNIGMVISTFAGLLNLGVAVVLLRAGRKYDSIALEADGRHLLTDVWTTAAILIALGGISLTGWQILDPISAFVAALQILWIGGSLIVRSIAGLLDVAMPDQEKAAIETILDRYRLQGVSFHDFRTRQAGSQRLMTLHVLVPGEMTVKEGHDLLERIESDIREIMRNIIIVTHLEPLGDPSSFKHERIKNRSIVSPQRRENESENRKGLGSRRQYRRRQEARFMGVLLMVLGGAISMIVENSFYADMAMGGSLMGLMVFLSSRTRQKMR